MACIITYKNNKYSQQEFEKYFKNNFNEFINEFLSQNIEGFKKFVEQQKEFPSTPLEIDQLDLSDIPELEEFAKWQDENCK